MSIRHAPSPALPLHLIFAHLPTQTCDHTELVVLGPILISLPFIKQPLNGNLYTHYRCE